MKKIFKYIISIIVTYIMFALLYVISDFLFGIVYAFVPYFIIAIIIPVIIWFYIQEYVTFRVLSKLISNSVFYIVSQVMVLVYMVFLKYHSYIWYLNSETSQISEELQHKIFAAEMTLSVISCVLIALFYSVMKSLAKKKSRKNNDYYRIPID